MSIEEQIRTLDDPTKRICDLASTFSLQFGLSINTCENYLSAKRAGYSSFLERNNSQAKARGYESRYELTMFRKAQEKYGSAYTLEQFRSNKFGKHARKKQELEEYVLDSSINLGSLRKGLSEREERIKSLDDPTLKICESAKNIAKIEGILESTAARYISNLRAGFTDHAYMDFLSTRAGFSSRGENISFVIEQSKNPSITLEEFREANAKKEGFQTTEEYTRFIEESKLFFPSTKPRIGKKISTSQKRFEYSGIEFFPPKRITTMKGEYEMYSSDSSLNEELWDFLQGALPKKQYYVLFERFVKDRTLDEIGQELDYTRERIRQLEQSALRKLRHPSNAKFLKTFLK